jgi:phosphate transport system substrate-binding protein
MKPIRFAAIAVFTLLSAGAAAQTLEIAGSTSVQKAILEPSAAKAREVTGLDIKVLPVGSGKGLVMLSEGKVKVAAISDALDDAVSSAKKAGMTNTPAGLKLHTVINEKLVPIVHPDNAVKALSMEQLKSVLSGKVVNWKDVGGADLPIVVVTGAPGSGTRAVIEKQVLGGAGYGPNSKELRATSAEIAEVARDKGAIGFVGDGLAESSKGKIREVSGPNVTRPLGLVTVGDPSPEVRKLLDFLQSADAKKLFVQ